MDSSEELLSRPSIPSAFDLLVLPLSPTLHSHTALGSRSAWAVFIDFHSCTGVLAPVTESRFMCAFDRKIATYMTEAPSLLVMTNSISPGMLLGDLSRKI